MEAEGVNERAARSRERVAVVWAIAVAALGALLVSTGCGSHTAAQQPSTEKPMPSRAGAETAPRPIQTSEAVPPKVAAKDFSIPGQWNLGGTSRRFAAFKGTETSAFGDAPILVLNLQSGSHAVVREHAVNWQKRYGVLGLRCSDGWIVWEELRGNEQKAPYDCEWKLYAAKIENDGRAASEPILLDESITSIATRPLFALIGDEVFWMTNSAPSGHQEGTVWGSRIKGRRLPDGETRTVFEAGTNIAALSESEGRLIATQFVDNDSDEVVVKVVDPATGTVVSEFEPRNGASRIAHFPKVHGNARAWTLLDAPDTDETTLLYSDETTSGVLEGDAIDPVIVGRYLFYETLRVERTAGGVGREVQRIRGFDPGRMECFTLYESRPEIDGTWQIWMAQGYDDSRFVLVNNTPNSMSDTGSATRVRVCEVK